MQHTFFSFLPKLNPGVPFSTITVEIPWGPRTKFITNLKISYYQPVQIRHDQWKIISFTFCIEPLKVKKMKKESKVAFTITGKYFAKYNALYLFSISDGQVAWLVLVLKLKLSHKLCTWLSSSDHHNVNIRITTTTDECLYR